MSEGDLDRYAAALADGVESALPGWVVASVSRVMIAWAGEMPEEIAEAATAAGRRAQKEVGVAVRQLLGLDIDEQKSTPLSLLRGAVRYPTEILVTAGVPPVRRDAFAERSFPEDPYGLSPATFADLDPALGDIGLAWGAAKAFEHKRRHGPRS